MMRHSQTLCWSHVTSYKSNDCTTSAAIVCGAYKTARLTIDADTLREDLPCRAREDAAKVGEAHARRVQLLPLACNRSAHLRHTCISSRCGHVQQMHALDVLQLAWPSAVRVPSQFQGDADVNGARPVIAKV